MAPTPAPRCWLHLHAEIRSSSIAGTGLFARAPLAAGTVVARVGGRLLSHHELQDLLTGAALRPDGPYIDTIAVTETTNLLLPPRSEQSIGYSNHSCDPNLWWDGPYTLVARRDISTNEELTSDYATSTWDPAYAMNCVCGSLTCRETITGSDWQLPELCARYGKHWVPALLTRIAATS